MITFEPVQVKGGFIIQCSDPQEIVYNDVYSYEDALNLSIQLENELNLDLQDEAYEQDLLIDGVN